MNRKEREIGGDCGGGGGGMSESENLLGKFSVCKAVVDLNHNLIIFLHLEMEFYSSTSFLACSGNK